MNNLEITDPLEIAIIAVILLLLAWRRPIVLVGIIIAVPYATRIVIGPTTLFHLAWLSAGSGLVKQIVTHQLQMPRLSQYRYLLAALGMFALWILINGYLPARPEYDLVQYRWGLFVIRGVIPVLLILVLVQTPRQVIDLLKVLVVISAVTSLIGWLVVPEVLNQVLADSNSRLSLYNVDGITFSTMIGLGAVLSLSLYSDNARHMLISLVVLAISLPIVLLSKTRQVLVAIGMALVVQLVLARRRRYLFMSGTVIVGLLGAFFALWQDTTLFDKFANTLADPLESDAYRLARYDEALRDFISSPLIGIGTAQYGAYLGYIELGSGETFADKDHAHNFLLEILAEQGLIGIALYFWFLAIALRPLLRDRAMTVEVTIRNALLTGFIYGLTQSMFTGGFFTSYHLYWLPALAYVAYRVKPGVTAVQSQPASAIVSRPQLTVESPL